ncbi:cryptochrome/photolyase family protein [Thalassolituus sp.]|uniref:cryptochrome/photolyase family protein n=1 Tax=Thalassolituus sp. TaxID=2030822 RepID=UPI003517A5A7
MRIGLILGDQLTPSLASLRVLDPACDQLIMAEVVDEATYVGHHPQKIALLFSAMRHFADELRQMGWQVHYHKYDPQSEHRSLLDVVTERVRSDAPSELVLTQCGEYRLQHAMDMEWQDHLGIPVTIYGDDRFLCSTSQFAAWADGRKQLRMEYFYREMRRETGYLMKDGEPEGGQWNFDSDNRKRWDGKTPFPEAPVFSRDDIDRDVLALVREHFSHHTGNLTHFPWATRRHQAEQALSFFIENALPAFGDFQDAMVRNEKALFHSLLSPYINCGLLTPRQVCDAAEQAWREGLAPLNAVEGFIRQIIGWREYVRGIYWLHMPGYAKENTLKNSRSLPHYYWDGDTRMACMADCFRNTFDNAYAHHIQRLMVTGNFALLAGIHPEEICEWYLAVYADAYEWVELPNTLGMVMHADGGYLGSKPYAASGNYIHKMSDYCKHCDYQVKTRSDSDSCPFNSLYWHFIHRHEKEFSKNPRMAMIYRSFAKMQEDERQRTLDRAEHLLIHLEEL